MAIYTIGYGNRTPEEFMRLVKALAVAYLVDVRAYPYSRHEPQYNQDKLANLLRASGIRYLFWGRELGGRPKNPSYYVNGRVNYKLMSTDPLYIGAIERLVTADRKNLRVIAMCSEMRPEQCHRSKLIGVSLAQKGRVVLHVDEQGQLVTQDDVLNRLTGRQYRMFDTEEVYGTSRKRYQ